MRGIGVAFFVILAACGPGGAVNVCPDGNPCLRLVDHPAVGGNGATGDDGGAASVDLAPAAAAADLGTPSTTDQGAAPADLTSSPNDLAAACVATGGSCSFHNDSVCCSKYCIYATNTCK